MFYCLVLFISFLLYTSVRLPHHHHQENQRKKNYIEPTSTFTPFKPVDCVVSKKMPCLTHSDCAAFCTRTDLQCKNYRCSIPDPPSRLSADCLRKNGGQLILKGVDSLGQGQWECQCRRPELFQGVNCEKKIITLCKNGTLLPYDLSMRDTVSCACNKGFTLRYVNSINPTSQKIPTCVKSNVIYEE